MRILLVIFFFCALFGSQIAFSQAAKQAPTKTAVGKFIGLEQGDYFYFKIMKDDKTELTLRVDKPDAFYDKVEKNTKSYLGKKIKVYYQHTKVYTPEAGGDVEVDLYIKAELVK
jgi:hypothetical protein